MTKNGENTVKKISLILLIPALALGQVEAVLSPIPTITPGATIPYDSPRYVFLGPETSVVTISYPAILAAPNAAAVRTTFTVNRLNAVKPMISADVVANADGTFGYSYNLTNDPTAADPIRVWSIALPATDGALKATHSSWTVTPKPAASGAPLVSMTQVSDVTWRSPATTSIVPGQTVGGFHLTSSYLPGFTMISARSAEDYALPGVLPESVSAQLAVMKQPQWMNEQTISIGPRFLPEWSKSLVAGDFKTGIARLIAHGQIDPSSTFAKTALPALDTVTEGPSSTVADAIAGSAVTPLEKTIAAALAVSLR